MGISGLTLGLTGWTAIGMTALAVAAMLFVVASALIRDMATLRKRTRALMQNYRDVSEQKSLEAAGRAALAAALDHAGDFVLVLDADGTILEANAGYRAFAGKHGLSCARFDLPRSEGLASTRLRNGRFEQAVNGLQLSWHIGSERVHNGSMRMVAVGRPQTSAEAADSHAAKSRFLATVSHEMRTPLNGVLGMAGLLRDTGLTPEQTSYVEAVETSGEALLSLINEILDFSRIEAGKIEFNEEPVEIARLAESVVELLSPRAQDKGIEIAAFIGKDVPEKVLADPARLRQILTNLAGNAVKFTESGGVGIRIETEADAMLVIQVADTGPGIEADRQHAIFEEFEQADAGTARKHGGTGLGLAITRRIVEHLGGSIALISKPGAGSIFRVALPLRQAGAQKVGTGHLHLRNISTLIVSASPFEAPFLAERMQRLGATVRLVADEAAAPSAMAASDVLIVDAKLGLDACRRLTDAAIKVGIRRRLVLLSPYERRSFGAPVEAGFDGYLIKPVRERSLAARFDAGLEPPVERAEPAAGDSGLQPLAGCRVLLAEDNLVNALLVQKLIERMGGETEWVEDGRAALAALSDRATTPFSLALVDLRMPGMTGLDLVAELRRMEAAGNLPHLPVAALTANAFAEDRQSCLAAGFDAFLSKPLERAAFERTLTELALVGRKAA